MLWASAAVAVAQTQVADPATALRQRYVALSHTLETSPILKGVQVQSNADERAPRGDAYAVIDYPFAMVAVAFEEAGGLCGALILHINVHYCRAMSGGESPSLALALGRKTPQSLDDTHRIELKFQAERRDGDFMRVELTAGEGPLDTSDYLIALELVALDDRRTFLHIRYAYRQGIVARMATRVYFATKGNEKVGFSLVTNPDDGSTQPVRGIRGVLERNTMRYYLAFDAYLHSASLPQAQRFEASLERWFEETERFARQLREVGRDDYLAMKRAQHLRLQSDW